MGAYGFYRAGRPPRVGVLRHDGPRLRQRVDSALLVLRRAKGRPIVEIRASIPVAIPGELQHPREPSRFASVALRTLDVAALVAERRPLLQHDDQQPSQPHALTAPLVTHAIHPVVPISGADER